MIELPEIFIVSRFHGSDGKVVCSFDCSYSWHRVDLAEKIEPPAWEETSPQLRALFSIILVEATTGVILALRSCSYSPEFTRSIPPGHRRPGPPPLRPGRARGGRGRHRPPAQHGPDLAALHGAVRGGA